MSASIMKAPFGVPRWMVHIFLNNFLDQDTFLLATQQRNVLSTEAKVVRGMKENGTLNKSPTGIRKNLYVYRSPTEKMGMRIGTFFDETLNRSPKRVPTLLNLEQSGDLRKTPTREVVLDRDIQHTQICPDSQRVVKNCGRIRRASVVASLLVPVIKAWAFATTLAPTIKSVALAARLNRVLRSDIVCTVLGICALSWWLAGKVRREFFFKYKESYHNKDLDNIPNVWAE